MGNWRTLKRTFAAHSRRLDTRQMTPVVAVSSGHLGQPDHAMLGRDVGRHHGAAGHAARAGVVDDAAPIAFQHTGQQRLAGHESRGEINTDDPVPVVLREALHRRGVLDAGVVHQDGDRSQRSSSAAFATIIWPIAEIGLTP